MKGTISTLIRGCSPVIIATVTVGGIWLTRNIVSEMLRRREMTKILEKWKDSPKDVVILHAIGRGKTAPNISPFVVKLETYLRMTNIRYEMDFSNPWSSKGKTPWITLNGEHVADSQIIIQYLARKYNKTLGNYNDYQRAVARAIRILMDEHFYWGLGLWRFVFSEGKGFDEINAMPPKERRHFYKGATKRVKANAWCQGTGRHDQNTVVEMMLDNLKTVSTILGENKFLLGDNPCEEDCSVFGFLSQVMWCTPGSPYLAAMNDLPNLKDYCIRMKETFWPDWDKCLIKGKEN